MKDEKILASEQLTDEDLEKVVGGYEGGEDDEKFLNALFGGKMNLSSDDLLRAAWGKAGVMVRLSEKKVTDTTYSYMGGVYYHTKTVYTPHYFADGQEITQSQARKHAMKFTGKILDITDWQ